MSESTEVAPVEAGSRDLEQFRTLYDPDLDFRKLLGESTYFSRSFRLIEKDDLIGVPLIVISLTYREGYSRKENDKTIVGDYVSVEAIVADEQTLGMPQFRKQLPATLNVFPNEAVIFNDGGTGIRRDMTKLLDDLGMIEVGGHADDDRRYDRPYSLWKSGADLAQAGITVDSNGEKFRYTAIRGLRKSEYESPFGPAETFYFA